MAEFGIVDLSEDETPVEEESDTLVLDVTPYVVYYIEEQNVGYSPAGLLREEAWSPRGGTTTKPALFGKDLLPEMLKSVETLNSTSHSVKYRVVAKLDLSHQFRLGVYTSDLHVEQSASAGDFEPEEEPKARWFERLTGKRYR